MAHLTPEQRSDKNGKLVTRHVRTQGVKSTGRLIPPPVSSSEALLAEFEAQTTPWGGGEEILPVMRSISQSNPDLFHSIMRSYLDGGSGERGVWRMAMSRYDSARTVKEEYFQRLTKVVPMSVALYEDAPPGYRLGRISKAAEVAEKHTSVHPLDDDYSPAQAWIILREVEGLDVAGCQSRSQDMDFIAANMEAVLPLLPDIRKRRTASMEFIRELIENQADAMRDGVL